MKKAKGQVYQILLQVVIKFDKTIMNTLFWHLMLLIYIEVFAADTLPLQGLIFIYLHLGFKIQYSSQMVSSNSTFSQPIRYAKDGL